MSEKAKAGSKENVADKPETWYVCVKLLLKDKEKKARYFIKFADNTENSAFARKIVRPPGGSQKITLVK